MKRGLSSSHSQCHLVPALPLGSYQPTNIQITRGNSTGIGSQLVLEHPLTSRPSTPQQQLPLPSSSTSKILRLVPVQMSVGGKRPESVKKKLIRKKEGDLAVTQTFQMFNKSTHSQQSFLDAPLQCNQKNLVKSVLNQTLSSATQPGSSTARHTPTQMSTMAQSMNSSTEIQQQPRINKQNVKISQKNVPQPPSDRTQLKVRRKKIENETQVTVYVPPVADLTKLKVLNRELSQSSVETLSMQHQQSDQFQNFKKKQVLPSPSERHTQQICEVQSMIQEIKTLFFHEDLTLMRNQLRVIVQKYDHSTHPTLADIPSKQADSSRERLKQFLNPHFKVVSNLQNQSINISNQSSIPPEELELKNSIEIIDKRLRSLIEVQTKSTASSFLTKEHYLDNHPYQMGQQKRSQSLSHKSHSRRQTPILNLQHALMQVKTTCHESYEVRHQFVKQFNKRLELLELINTRSNARPCKCTHAELEQRESAVKKREDDLERQQKLIESQEPDQFQTRNRELEVKQKELERRAHQLNEMLTNFVMPLQREKPETKTVETNTISQSESNGPPSPKPYESPKFFIASPKPTVQDHIGEEHFSFQGSHTNESKKSSAEPAIISDEESDGDNFVLEEYRIKQQKMLGELNQIYQEKTKLTSNLRLAMTDSEGDHHSKHPVQTPSSINDLQMLMQADMLEKDEEPDIDIGNYKDIAEQEHRNLKKAYSSL